MNFTFYKLRQKSINCNSLKLIFYQRHNLKFKKADIIIISYNTQKLTLECISSIYKTANQIVNEIIVVDNFSTDGSPDAIKNEFPKVKLIVNSKNLGYAKAVNIGISAASSEIFIISNSDVVFKENSIRILIEYLISNPDIAVCGPRQLYPDSSYQYSYGDVPGLAFAIKKLFLINHLSELINKKKWEKGIKQIKHVSYVDGAVMAINRKAFEEVDGFDEDYFFYTEEADFCYRVKKNGWKVVHNPNSVILHYRGATDINKGFSYDRLKEMVYTKILFCKKHLSFQKTKFYVISEIIYSVNMIFLWTIITIFRSSKNKDYIGKWKIKYNKLMLNIWLDELNQLLKNDE